MNVKIIYKTSFYYGIPKEIWVNNHNNNICSKVAKLAEDLLCGLSGPIIPKSDFPFLNLMQFKYLQYFSIQYTCRWLRKWRQISTKQQYTLLYVIIDSKSKNLGFEYGKSKNKFNYRNKQILPNTSGTSLPSGF